MFIFEFIQCLTCFTARCVYILIIAHIAMHILHVFVKHLSLCAFDMQK